VRSAGDNIGRQRTNGTATWNEQRQKLCCSWNSIKECK